MYVYIIIIIIPIKQLTSELEIKQYLVQVNTKHVKQESVVDFWFQMKV